jgi:hypothetical protein
MIKGSNVNRKLLIEHLSQGTCKVQFRKATNGRYRSLYCTLNSKQIPGKYQQSVAKTIEGGEDPNLMPVFDIVSRDWKSFYINNILYMYTEDELKGKKTKKK